MTYEEIRIKHYNSKIGEMYSKVQELEGRPKERMFDEINILQEAVSRLERGMQTETKKVTVNAVVEIEDDSCAGGACKI